MTINFPVGPDDPEYIHLAAPLMQNISPGFTSWLSVMMAVSANANAASKAFCFAIGTLLSVLAEHTAKPDQKEAFYKSMVENIHKSARFADLSRPRKDPDESLN